MGHFDKQETPNQGPQKSKLLLAVGLAAALAVVVGMQLSKSSPRVATASPNPVPSDPAVSLAPVQPRTVIEELDALAKDPTANLLHGSNPQDTTVLAPPRDPFRMSETLHASLSKPEVVQTQIAPNPQPRATAVSPLAANLDGLKLQGIFLEHQKLAAIVNGNIIHPGMIVGNVRICDILEDRIIVQNPSFPAGPRTDVLLKAQLNK
jgi:hypothetical protein